MNVVPKDGGNRFSGYRVIQLHRRPSADRQPHLRTDRARLDEGERGERDLDATERSDGPDQERRALVLHGTPIVGEFEPRRRGVSSNNRRRSARYCSPACDHQTVVAPRQSALASAHMAGVAAKQDQPVVRHSGQLRLSSGSRERDAVAEATAIYSYEPDYLVQGSCRLPLSNRLLLQAA